MKLEISLLKARQELCSAILNSGTPLNCVHIDYKLDLFESNHVNVEFDERTITFTAPTWPK